MQAVKDLNTLASAIVNSHYTGLGVSSIVGQTQRLADHRQSIQALTGECDEQLKRVLEAAIRLCEADDRNLKSWEGVQAQILTCFGGDLLITSVGPQPTANATDQYNQWLGSVTCALVLQSTIKQVTKLGDAISKNERMGMIGSARSTNESISGHEPFFGADIGKGKQVSRAPTPMASPSITSAPPSPSLNAGSNSGSNVSIRKLLPKTKSEEEKSRQLRFAVIKAAAAKKRADVKPDKLMGLSDDELRQLLDEVLS